MVEKKIREIVVFVLNFMLPGLGFLFSGFVHRLRWLRRVGLGVIAIYLLLFIRSLTPYNFDIWLASSKSDILDTALSLAVSFTFGSLGAGLEHEMK